jgi:hypothetical protein
MINCASIALFNSQINCRCIPIAVCILIKSSNRNSSSVKNFIQVDPDIAQIRDYKTFSHKILTVANVESDEFIYSNMISLGERSPVDLRDLE